MIKKAYSVSMSYDVSDEEKKQAENALIYFDASQKKLNIASNHLNIMKTPFKENTDITPESVMDARAAMRRFRDKSIENFNDFKAVAFKCVTIMQTFSSDTQSVKLMKSFISSIDSLELKVNSFSELFSDLQAKDFVSKIVESIENIQEDCKNVDELIDERIKTHIQTNILARSWVDNVSNTLQTKVEEKTPLLIELFNKRQEQLNEAIKEKTGK